MSRAEGMPRNQPRILTVGPVPPVFGGGDTGGVHAHVALLYKQMGRNVRRQILVTNPSGPETTQNDCLRQSFEDLSLPPPASPITRKIGSSIANSGRLTPRSLTRSLAASMNFRLSPLMVLFH